MLEQEILAYQEFTLSEGIFLYGLLDKKYAQFYRELQRPSLEISGSGHASHSENSKRYAASIRQGIKDI
jgi:hypothetical protein